MLNGLDEVKKTHDFLSRHLLIFLCLNPILAGEAQTQSPPAVSTVEAGESKDSRLLVTTSLKEGVKNGKILLQVKGDGVSTSSIRAIITNKTGSALKITIPANEILQPNLPGVAKMMIVDARDAEVPSNKIIVVGLVTVSVSTITTPPIPNRIINCTCGAYPDRRLWHQFASIVAAARELESTHAYDRLPLKVQRQMQLTQLTIWRLIGIVSGKPQDAVTPQKIGNDVLKEMSVKVNKDPALWAQLVSAGYRMTPQGKILVPLQRKKSFDNNASSIYQAIDMTLKRSQETRLKVQPLPDSTRTRAKASSTKNLGDDSVDAQQVLTAPIEEPVKK